MGPAPVFDSETSLWHNQNLNRSLQGKADRWRLSVVFRGFRSNHWTLSGDLQRAQEDSSRVEFYQNYTVPKLELLSKEKLHREYRFWYPFSKEYSYIFNYPDDIQDDWKE